VFCFCPQEVLASSVLTPCKDSQTFEKRLTNSVKKTESRLKFYSAESKEAEVLRKEVESIKARFDQYKNSNLLCGKEGLPRIIASGELNHANEFMLPAVLFLYITGWIGWVGRKYLSYASSTKDSFSNEIIIDVPVALPIIASGFLWPIEALITFKNRQLIFSDENITTSPR
jgi:photosystem I subunit 3